MQEIKIINIFNIHVEMLFQKLIVAGCDEAGRGSLVGPVVAASVILPKDFNCNIINDSKLLSEKKEIMHMILL